VKCLFEKKDPGNRYERMGGCVLTMGKSTRGQLGCGSGCGSTSSSDGFRQLDVLDPLRFVKVVAGGWHSLVLTGRGKKHETPL